MASRKLITIIGATGAQGGSVVDTFLSDSAWKVRAVTRNKDSAKAQALQARGAEVVVADLNDVESLLRAFQGTNAIFGVTDFWTLYGDQTIASQLKAGQSMMEVVAQLETQQGKNIFDAAAKIPTLERLIYSSLPNTRKLSKGKYTKAWHLESKALAAEYGQETYPELWAKTSLIKLGYYLTNLVANPITAPQKNTKTNTFDFPVYHVSLVLSLVATETDTGVLVKALVAASPGKNLAALRKNMTVQEYVNLWAHVVGVKARVVRANWEGLPDDFREELEDTFDFAMHYGFYGEEVDETLITPEELDPDLNLGTVEDWIRAQDWSPVLNPKQ